MIISNTFLIGAAKCGTTSLSYWLSQHSDVCLAYGKESSYWRQDYCRGESWYSKQHYQHYKNESITVDASGINQVLHYSPLRIRQMCPGAKIILSVRDPIMRAYSYWRMLASYRIGRTHTTFASALQHNLKSFGPDKFMVEGDFVPYLEQKGECYIPSFIEQGLYWHNIQYYLDQFRMPNIHIVEFDDIANNPSKVWDSLCSFLGIKTEVVDLSKSDPTLKIEAKEDDLNLPIDLLNELSKIYSGDLKKFNQKFNTNCSIDEFYNKWVKYHG